MKTWQKIALVGGVAAVGIGAAVMLTGGTGGKTTLNLSHGANGHTEPASGGYEFNPGDYVTLIAIPDSGYQVNVWTVDGNSQGAGNILPLLMSQNHNVTVTFTSITDGQTRIPASLVCNTTPPGMSVNLKQLYIGAFQQSTNKWHVKPVIDYANYAALDTWVSQVLEFQVLDVYGQPCANAPIIIYMGPEDYNDGELYFSDGTHLTIVVTGADGKATVSTHYANNDISALSRKRCYYKAHHGIIPDTPSDGGCMGEGDVWPGCPFPCISDEIGISYNAQCPNATVYGNQYEHETVPMQHTVRAEYQPNRSIAAYATLICWFGLKAAPTVWYP